MKRPRSLAAAEAEVRRLRVEILALKRELERQYAENRFVANAIQRRARMERYGKNWSRQ